MRIQYGGLGWLQEEVYKLLPLGCIEDHVLQRLVALDVGRRWLASSTADRKGGFEDDPTDRV